MLFVDSTVVIAQFAWVPTWAWIVLGAVLAPPVIFAVGIWLSPVRFVWCTFWLFATAFYRFKLHGVENLPATESLAITLERVVHPLVALVNIIFIVLKSGNL